LGDEFFSLDKSELKLYSTLEPCPMCKGVLVNQNIYNIYFEMDKSLLKRTKNTLKNLFYEFNKRGIKDENIQDSLINLYHRKNN
jgi:tRNA(Arg) A34 adenosine deaminase TadA